MKVAYNACYGGFSLSDKAYKRLIELGIPLDPPNEDTKELAIFTWKDDPFKGLMGKYYDNFDRSSNEYRSHPLIIQVIEELGDEASGMCANLKIEDVPDDVKWHIHEYDGFEHIAENHRTWPGGLGDDSY